MTRATRGTEDTTQVSNRVGLAVEGFLSLCRHVQTAGPCVIGVFKAKAHFGARCPSLLSALCA
jgi:hypothetical protein